MIDKNLIFQLRELPLRHFNRMFVVVPQGSGFCIVNEMLHVTLPTANQADVSPNVVRSCFTQGMYGFTRLYAAWKSNYVMYCRRHSHQRRRRRPRHRQQSSWTRTRRTCGFRSSRKRPEWTPSSAWSKYLSDPVQDGQRVVTSINKKYSSKQAVLRNPWNLSCTWNHSM